MPEVSITPFQQALQKVEKAGALEEVRAAVKVALVDAEKAQAEIESINVTDEGSQFKVTEWLGITKSAAKALDTQRDALMRPLNDKRNYVLGFFKEVEAIVATVTTSAEGKLIAWKRAQDLRAAIEQAHDDAIRDGAARELQRIEAERQERERLAREEAERAAAAGAAPVIVPEVVNVEEERRIAEARATLTRPAEKVMPAARGVRTDYGTSSVGDDFDYVVNDAWALPRHFVKAPEPRRSSILQEIRELHKGGKLADDAALSTAIAGITITRKDKVNFR